MKIFRYVISALLLFCILFTCFFGIKIISKEKIIKSKESGDIILSVWQVDSFEGGTGSRRKFLLDVARSFEKKEKVLIMVISHTKMSAEESMGKGIYPDIISYGNGVNVSNIKEIKTKRSFDYGKISNKQYAIPWCRGGYVYITNKNNLKKSENKTVISMGDYTLPFINFIGNKDFKNYAICSTKQGFSEFVNGRAKNLIGTQRDVVKLLNLGLNVEISPLTEFNDLYQYLSLTSTDFNKSVIAERFINYLISDEIQSKLDKISMFSPYLEVNFDNEHLKNMQNITFNSGISAFTMPEKIKEIQGEVNGALSGDDKTLTKIKNVLI